MSGWHWHFFTENQSDMPSVEAGKFNLSQLNGCITIFNGVLISLFSFLQSSVSMCRQISSCVRLEDHSFTFSSASHLWTFEQKGIPDLEEDVAHHTVHEHHQEPVEGDEGEVHLVLLKVGVKPGQFLAHQVLEHTLVNLHRHDQHKIFIFFTAGESARSNPAGRKKTNSADCCAAFFLSSVMNSVT